MTLPSEGPLSISQIADEFGGVPPHSLSEYYGAASGIPTSGAISISDFYDASSGVMPDMFNMGTRQRTNGDDTYNFYENTLWKYQSGSFYDAWNATRESTEVWTASINEYSSNKYPIERIWGTVGDDGVIIVRGHNIQLTYLFEAPFVQNNTIGSEFMVGNFGAWYADDTKNNVERFYESGNPSSSGAAGFARMFSNGYFFDGTTCNRVWSQAGYYDSEIDDTKDRPKNRSELWMAISRIVTQAVPTGDYALDDPINIIGVDGSFGDAGDRNWKLLGGYYAMNPGGVQYGPNLVRFSRTTKAQEYQYSGIAAVGSTFEIAGTRNVVELDRFGCLKLDTSSRTMRDVSLGFYLDPEFTQPCNVGVSRNEAPDFDPIPLLNRPVTSVQFEMNAYIPNILYVRDENDHTRTAQIRCIGNPYREHLNKFPVLERYNRFQNPKYYPRIAPVATTYES